MSSLTICWTLLLIYSWIVWNDNDVNEDVSQRLAESRSAGNGVRRSQLSFSEILTTGVGRKNLRLKIACWIVRTLLEKGKLENVKQEMAPLGLKCSGSESSWPGEDYYKSDGFRTIIHAEKKARVAIILDKRTYNCVEKVWCEGDRLLMVKLKGMPVDMCIIQVKPTCQQRET